MPAESAYLWAWFRELDDARGSSGFGANPLAWTEIEAWARMRRLRLTPWELGTLRALDGARLDVMAQSLAGANNKAPT